MLDAEGLFEREGSITMSGSIIYFQDVIMLGTSGRHRGVRSADVMMMLFVRFRILGIETK